MDDLRREEYQRFFEYHPETVKVSAREFEFIDVKPKAIEVQIPLVEYFERIKRYKADRFQTDLCARLQDAAEQRHIERYWGIIHAEAQLGKTSVISQTFPAWLIGHDPLFRFALGMYNQTRSEAHSQVVIQILKSNLHKDIFPDQDGWLFNDAKTGWMTNARRELNDGQLSFNPVGLQSGLTGSGFDWLSIDDPYKESKEAFSETVRENMANFWDFTVMSRVGLHSCVTGMFHRYAPEDFAGFLLDKGDFDYLRYATVADGDYIHDSTGQRFADPLGRADGEYISPERRPPEYYEKARKNNRVWLSMFQGKPSSEEGEFFNVGKIRTISPEAAAAARSECVAIVRSYDHAATENAGAYSVGALLGIKPSGGVTVFDLWRERVDSATRLGKQQELAAADGTDVTITIPNDPGSAGSDVVWFTQQKLEGYTVVPRPTSGSKEDRAKNFSVAVNSGEVEFVDDEKLPEEKQWNKKAKQELRDFPLSEFKDIVDAMSDGYNHLYSVFRKGLVVQNYKPQRNLAFIDNFVEKFPFFIEDRPIYRIPEKFTVYAGVKLSLDSSRATSGVIVARASANSKLSETLFVIGEYKAWDSNFYRVFDWIDETRRNLFPKNDFTVFAHPDSKAALETIHQKSPHRLVNFEADEFAGITEMNWYLRARETAHPLNAFEQGTGLIFLIPPDQFEAAEKPDKPENDPGFYYARQEIKNWGFDDKSKPNKIGGVMDCLRMLTFRFRTFEEPLTLQEEFEVLLPKNALPKQNDDGTYNFSKEDQMRLDFERQRAEDALREKYGDDVFDSDRGSNWWDD